MNAVAKIAVVTGAGSGIGRSVALTPAGAGRSVVLAGRRAEALEETASLAGGDVLCVPTDVTSPADVTTLFATARDRHGSVGLLFNNAGTSGPRARFEDLSYEDWRAVVDVNLTGAFLCAQAAFRMMKDQSPQGGDEPVLCRCEPPLTVRLGSPLEMRSRA